MKVTFTSPIVEEDITRTRITVDHIIIYPGNQVVINNKGGSNKTLPLTGLTKEAQGFFDSFLAALSGEVTARAVEAEKLIFANDISEPIVVIEEAPGRP